jgi:hypothetical protein
MAFPTGTIKLEAARKIFVGVDIEVHKLGEKVLYYSTIFKGELLESDSLTALCLMLWSNAVAR